MFFSNTRFWATAFLVAFACVASEADAAEMKAQIGAAVTPDMALSFDGIDDYVSLGVPAPLQNPSSNDFTIFTWVRLENASSFRRILFAQQNNSNFVSIAQNVGNTLYVFVGSNGVQHSVATSSSFALATWVHVAVVWKSADESISIFINGVQSPTTGGGQSSAGTDGLMTLGSRSGTGQYFGGSLDRLAIYGAALTNAQILRAAAQCIYPQGASNSYAFDQGVANGNNTGVTTLLDGSGNQPGTLHGFALSGTVSNWIDSSISSSCPPPTYIVSGSVSGLAGSGLTLQLNGTNDLSIAANGAFQFPAIADGSNYSVTVATRPVNPAQQCTVANGSGTLASADVSSVQVNCVAATPPDQPTSVTAVPGNGQATVTWTAPVVDGGATVTAYLVTGTPGGTCSVSGAPPATTCTVPNLINGTAYTFSVMATNALGDSLASAPSNPVTPRVDFVSIPTLNQWALLTVILGLTAMGIGQLRKYPHPQ